MTDNNDWLLQALSSLGPSIREDKKREAEATKTYLVRNPITGFLKIGKSIDPGTRVKALSRQNGVDLELLSVLNKNVELEMHHKFKKLRGIGEWFEDPKGLILKAFNSEQKKRPS